MRPNETVPGYIRGDWTVFRLRHVLHGSLAGFAIGELLFDPFVRGLEAFADRNAGFPAKDLLDEGVIAVASGDALRRAEIVSPLQFHAGDFLRDTDQIIDRNQFAAAKIDGSGNQFVRVHDRIDALQAVVDVHETTGLTAVTPDVDLLLAIV